MDKVKFYLKNRRILVLSLLLIAFIGVSFAYVVAQISGGALKNANITADKTDDLKFTVSKEISLNPTQFNVLEGGSGLSDSAVGSAILKPNSTNGTATYTYYVYFDIISNNYVYTTDEQLPEIVLTITNPDGEEVTSVSGLKYVTATNADGTQVTGFDITTKSGLFNIASNYEISTTNNIEVTQDWTFTVTFINLTTNQHENGGKSLEGEVILSKEVYKVKDTTIAAFSNGVESIHDAYGNYDITTNCAFANWNYKLGGLEIDFANNSRVNCNVEYNPKTTTTYLNTYITGLSGSTQGDGQVVNENGYRYEGKNPNNYIWFNNELWRIIGVFDEVSHGQSGKNLVKIIRADSIGGLSWHKGDTNDWTAASLMNLLNGAYLNAQDGTDSGYCYGASSVPSNCDYTNTGISATYRNMIVNAKWYLGGYSSDSATAEAFYGYERGTTVYSGRPTEWEGKIGLMYPSDYGYSVLSSSCARTTNLSSYGSSRCAGKSWLYGQGYEWTLTPSSSSRVSVFRLTSSGGLTPYNAYSVYSARPVLYLDSLVYVIDGNGTMSNPYIIGM